jgi:aerobic-type carbon monoxide dehydrogenase small subunit (CoxS/CutS family)
MSEEKGNKSGEEADKEGFGRISRRTFLRDAGLVVGAPAIGTLTTSATAATPTAAARPAVASQSAEESAAAGTIELTVNGGRYRFNVEPDCSLRKLLRDEIGLTSVKDWCGGQGACGSCTVIMDGRPILSCLTLASECNGANIETAEGIAKTKHPIIQAYINNNAFQCGYCTPGFVCTAKALLDKNHKPTEAEVRDALGGNLCRCATYQQHPLAVLEAAKSL